MRSKTHSDAKTWRWGLGLAICACQPALMGFVLLSSSEAKLPVTPAAPVITFVWDGNAPGIKEKSEFKGGIYADLDDTGFMQALLLEAMDLWNRVPASFVTLELAEQSFDGEAKLDQDDRIFSIVTQKSSNLSTAAFAKPEIPDDQRDTIVDCDISIADKSVEAKSLAFTIAHELGHCLGLGHAHTNYNAIMSYSRSARTLTLGSDDAAGIIYLYPDPAYDADKPRELVCGVVGLNRNLVDNGSNGSNRDHVGNGKAPEPSKINATLLALFALPLGLLLLGAGRPRQSSSSTAPKAT